MSEIVVQNRELLPPAVAQELDVWAARLNTRALSVDTSLANMALGWYNVKDAAYGAVGDGKTDDYAAIMRAYEAMPTHAQGGKVGTLYFPPGVYAHSKTFNPYGTNVRMLGDNAVLFFTGTGVCVNMDGTGSTYVFGGGIERMGIRGFTGATTGLRVTKTHHGRYVDIWVEDVTTDAFLVIDSVCNYFANPRCSLNENTLSPRPVTGINLSTSACSANTFVNAIIEGVSGNGIECNGGVRNIFLGGTSESNGGYGVSVLTGGYNEFHQIDCENNTTGDFELVGSLNTLQNCLGSSLQTYGGLRSTGGYQNVVIACQFHNISVTSDAHGLCLLNSGYSINGTGASAGTYSNSCADGTVFGVYNMYSGAKESAQFGKMISTFLLQWDNGSGTVDTNLYRNAANVLKTDDALIIGGDLTVSGNTSQLVNIFAGASSVIGWNTRSRLESPADGTFAFTNAAGSGSPKLRFGSTTTQPMLTNNGATLQVKDIAENGYAPFQCAALTTDGGAQTFGANDSGGAGYRLVRVPNV